VSLELFNLAGKTALVTGGTHGIGMAIGTALAQAGARLCVNDISADKLRSAREQYAARAVEVYTLEFDVTREAEVDRGCTQLERDVGPVDILVNNAGIILRTPMLEMSPEQFRQVLDIDLVAPLVVSKRIVPGMIARGGGKIVNMCSLLSFYGRNSVSAYAAAKGGLAQLTKTMCCEWARHNIQVNGIGPGYIATSQTAPIRVNGHPFNDLVMTRTPAGRWGLPEDLAGAALLLASRAGDYINGQIIYVDGGILANFGYVAGENDVKPPRP
jgi:gluconate 5-dehydrogenase